MGMLSFADPLPLIRAWEVVWPLDLGSTLPFNALYSSMMTWALAPPKPKLLIDARRNSFEGQAVSSVGTFDSQ